MYKWWAQYKYFSVRSKIYFVTINLHTIRLYVRTRNVSRLVGKTNNMVITFVKILTFFLFVFIIYKRNNNIKWVNHFFLYVQKQFVSFFVYLRAFDLYLPCLSCRIFSFCFIPTLVEITFRMLIFLSDSVEYNQKIYIKER